MFLKHPEGGEIVKRCLFQALYIASFLRSIEASFQTQIMCLFLYSPFFCCIFIPSLFFFLCPQWGCQLHLTLLDGSSQSRPGLGLCVCIHLYNVPELGAAKMRLIETTASSKPLCNRHFFGLSEYLSIHICDQYMHPSSFTIHI